MRTTENILAKAVEYQQRIAELERAVAERDTQIAELRKLPASATEKEGGR